MRHAILWLWLSSHYYNADGASKSTNEQGKHKKGRGKEHNSKELPHVTLKSKEGKPLHITLSSKERAQQRHDNIVARNQATQRADDADGWEDPLRRQRAARQRLRHRHAAFVPPSRDAAPLCANEKDFPMRVRSYSQLDEDQELLRSYFWNKRGGTYLEIGAYNGVWMSNTLLFEETYGWTGLLVEANPRLFDECVRHRRKATRVKAAVCRGGGPVLFGRARGQAPGSGRVFAPQSPAGLIGMTRATCVPFEDVTAAAGIERYDLASIDVEGSEFDILQSFDWRHVHVDVFIVEWNKVKGDVLADLLEDRGYTRDETWRGSDVNQVWLHANFTRSEAPASVWERVSVEKVSHRVSDVGLGYNYTCDDDCGACTKLGKF
jgi:FkbM family methyltransferase